MTNKKFNIKSTSFSTSYNIKYGFSTKILSDTFVQGLNQHTVLLVSKKKNEPMFLKNWRVLAYKHWITLNEPTWSNLKYKKINYSNIIYYSSPTTLNNKKYFKKKILLISFFKIKKNFKK